jgi:hypothetical protein
MGVDVGNRDGRSDWQPGPRGRFLGQAAGALAGKPDVAAHLVVDDRGKTWIEGREVARVGKAVGFRPQRLVAGGAGVPGLDSGQAPDDPVGGFEQAVRSGVDPGCLVEDLERLREEPLGRDPATVPIEPELAGRLGDGVDPVGFGLGGVVLPELDPRMRIRAELRDQGQRRAVGGRRQHRARREVDPQTDHVSRIDTRLAKDGRDRLPEDAEVVIRVLERPVRRKDDPPIGERQHIVDDAVRIFGDRRRELPAVGHVDQDRSAGSGPEIDADREAGHTASLLCRPVASGLRQARGEAEGPPGSDRQPGIC